MFFVITKNISGITMDNCTFCGRFYSELNMEIYQEENRFSFSEDRFSYGQEGIAMLTLILIIALLKGIT